MITAGHCYRDGDDEASVNPSVPPRRHPRGEAGLSGVRKPCISHLSLAPRGARAQAAVAGPRGQYLPSLA